MANKNFHDVMLRPAMPTRRWRRPRGRYYPTNTKRLSSGQVEVTFCLPPRVLKQWQTAINDGKRIRLLVAN